MNHTNREHIAEIKRSHRKRRLTQHQLDRMHFDTFSDWFKDKVSSMTKLLVTLIILLVIISKFIVLTFYFVS